MDQRLSDAPKNYDVRQEESTKLNPNEEVPSVELGSISGSLRTTEKAALAGGNVSAVAPINDETFKEITRELGLDGKSISIDDLHRSSYYAETATDPQGTFTLNGLPPAIYNLAGATCQ